MASGAVTSPLRADTEPPRTLPFAYSAAPARRDEVFGPDGTPHAHSEPLVAALAALGPVEMQRTWDRARRLIRDNGVTYNVYGDPRGMDRPWELDLVPLVIDAPTWAFVSRGLAQRAELLNRVLVDLYGPQNLVLRGSVPPELLLASPSFLRALCGAALPGHIALHLSATDLARRSDGSFCVLGDRTQAPSGAGYALENRIVLSRTLPDLFGDCHVERLAPYFRAMRDMLLSLSPRGRESPRIVLLTPGPHNETYFEHAYLARYLGFALVEGGDLTVRDRRVYLKTLRGLERVDVILRRLDDAFCDPLSLRADSSLGVAGLVHAVRAGNVAVANALGSGVVETPLLHAFLPRLCRELLGEDLVLPNLPTFWCGEPDGLSYTLSHLQDLVIRQTFESPSTFEPVFVGDLANAERDALADHIRARPASFVAQERIELSTAPVWAEGRLAPRPVALRAFVTRTLDGYRAMPGGLVRVAAERESFVVSMQRGAGSKDVWVLSGEEQVNPLTLLRTGTQPVAIVRSGGDMPSRVADNLFWWGRYLERAEGTVRLLRSLLARLTDDSVTAEVPELPALVRALKASSEFHLDGFVDPGQNNALDFALGGRLFSRDLKHSLNAAFRAASVVRDRLSADSWRIVSQLERLVEGATSEPTLKLSDIFEVLGELVILFSALNGLSMENMTHGPGWRFADMGRRVERLQYVVRLLRALLVPVVPEDGPTLEALLEIADSVITYRTRYPGVLEVAPVLDLLLTDETNPRSVAFQLTALRDHIEKLPHSDSSPMRPEEARIVLRVLSLVELADVHALSSLDAGAARPELDALLAELELAGPDFAESLTRSYLTHAQPSQSLDGLS